MRRAIFLHAVNFEYLQLDPRKIRATTERLRRRILERFPDRNLGSVAADLVAATDVAAQRATRIARPNRVLRFAIAAILIGVPALVVWLVQGLEMRVGPSTVIDVIQTVEAALGSIVFLGAAALFLTTVETRRKRKLCVDSIDELRALAHIVDMHQLTKDPERVQNRGADTASSPSRTLTAFEVSRYYDYCGEMLSLIAKIGSLYAQASSDAQVNGVVDDLESLVNGVDQKIWQKNELLHTLYREEIEGQLGASPAAAPETEKTPAD